MDFRKFHTTKNPAFPKAGLKNKGVWRRPTFTSENAHYHRRKAVSRSCSGWEGVVPARYVRQTKTFFLHFSFSIHNLPFFHGRLQFFFKKRIWKKWALSKIECYRIKPYGQLVSVSSTHCCAYTPDLSTLWSSTTLQVS